MCAQHDRRSFRLGESSEMENADAELVVYANPFTLALVGLSLAVILASLGAHLLYMFSGYAPYPIEIVSGTKVDNIVQLFSLDGEGNVPALFSTLMIFLAAFLFLLVALIKRTLKDQYVGHWTILSLGFLMMAVDEGLALHELLTHPVRVQIESEKGLGLFYHAWVVPAIAVVALIIVGFTRFFLHLQSPMRLKFFIAASLYLTGVIGFEMIGGYYAEAYGISNFTYVLIFTAEESLELSGIVMLIWTLLLYICENYKRLHVRFAKS